MPTSPTASGLAIVVSCVQMSKAQNYLKTNSNQLLFSAK